MTKVDLNFRPSGYGVKDRSVYRLYAGLTGKERSQAVKQILIHQRQWREWAARLACEELTEAERDWLPGLNYTGLDSDSQARSSGPTEIARIQLCSNYGESYSITADETPEGYIYDVTFDDAEVGPVIKPFRKSSQPLTLQEMINLIDNSYIEADFYSEGGLILGNWAMNLESGPVNEAVTSAWVDSVFYPQLSEHYKEVGEKWLQDFGIDGDCT